MGIMQELSQKVVNNSAVSTENERKKLINAYVESIIEVLSSVESLLHYCYLFLPDENRDVYEPLEKLHDEIYLTLSSCNGDVTGNEAENIRLSMKELFCHDRIKRIVRALVNGKLKNLGEFLKNEEIAFLKDYVAHANEVIVRAYVDVIHLISSLKEANEKGRYNEMISASEKILEHILWVMWKKYGEDVVERKQNEVKQLLNESYKKKCKRIARYINVYWWEA